MAPHTPPSRGAGCTVTISRLALIGIVVIFVAILAPVTVVDFISGIASHRDPSVSSANIVATGSGRRGSARQVVLASDPRGHFVSTARINGRRVEVMVDTGASVVALSAKTARRLGVLPAKSAYGLSMTTANGAIETAPIVLSEIKLGNITVRNVNAVVFPGNGLGVNLLGMSFLGRLSGFEIEKGELVLTQ